MKRFALSALLLTAGGTAISVGAPADQRAEELPVMPVVDFSAMPVPPDQQEIANVTHVAEGFEAQLVYDIPLETQGSWVALAVDPDGILYASDQNQAGVYRIEVGGDIDVPTAEVTKVALDVTGFQGMEWAFGTLYGNRNSNDPELAGLYRMRDSNGDGVLDAVEHLGVASGGGEHGLHDVILTEDGEGLYMIGGNDSRLPEGLARSTITGWEEDQLTPRDPDARGHARGRLAPGGFVLRVEPDGSDPVLLSMGYRNAYGLALIQHGELFTYDSDMEYDLGSPWYRDTRINHVVSGSDYGWRNGTGKWQPYFEESLPAVADIGPGSPTGVIMGTGANFPAKYQNALYALDWTYSTIFAIHLTPEGSSYTGEVEEFVFGDPFQVTDAEIGADGHMYVLTGGRGGKGHLWRIVYRGDESTAPAPPVDTPEARAARQLRQQLETFHGRQDPSAVNTAWPYLSSQDRFLRNAARVAVESQPVATWAQRALSEANPQARATAMVALARVGSEEHRAAAIRSLLELPMAQMTAEEKLATLRAFSLVFLRLGEPTEAERQQIIRALNPLLPAADPRVNVELVRNLVHLRDPNVTAKAMALMHSIPAEVPAYWGRDRMLRSDRYGENTVPILDNPPPTRALEYAWILRTHREGWTPELRRQYFHFLNEASEHTAGASYAGHMANMYAEALRNTTPEHRAAVSDLTGRTFVYEPDFAVSAPEGPGRAWQEQEAIAAVQPRLTGRDYESGRNLFFSTACAACHTMREYGSALGPDLTTLPDRRFNLSRLLEAIINPDELVEEHWRASEFTLADGRTIVGLPVYTGDRVTIRPKNPEQAPVEVARSQISSIRQLDTSAMPAGLINSLNEEELADLIAYLQSSGDPNADMFAGAGQQ